MEAERVEAYIQQRLAELDKGLDMREMTSKGKLSFGVDSTTYAHLPAWKGLLTQKKKLVRWIWVDAFLLSLTVFILTTDNMEKFGEDWLKALAGMFFISGMIMLFFVITAYYSLFYKFRQTEREVRKLIYQDILFQLKKEEKQTA